MVLILEPSMIIILTEGCALGALGIDWLLRGLDAGEYLRSDRLHRHEDALG